MIRGIGTDIIEIRSIQRAMEQSKRFAQRVFTENEIGYCENKPNKYQHYAARFAAKEAFFKAIGTGWCRGFAWTEVEVAKDEVGRPYIITHGKVKDFLEQEQITNVQMSLSHVKETATAIVILEK